MIPVTTKGPLTFLRPAFLLVKPMAAQELPDASIIWLFLRRLKRDESVEVLVYGSRIAGAAIGR